MNRLKASKACIIMSAVLLLCFVVKNPIDYHNYSTTLNSAPYYVWILVNALYFVLPAAVLLVIGLVLKRR